MNKKLLSFLTPFLILSLIVTLFPPTYGYSNSLSYKFLFSSTSLRISWGNLILEYLLILFFSSLISIIYIKYGRYLLSYFLSSIILSILSFFAVDFITDLFYPSYSYVSAFENLINSKYPSIFKHSDEGPYILGSNLADMLDSTFNYRSYEYRYGKLAPLPDSLFPVITAYLIPFNEDSLKLARQKSRSKFFLDEHNFALILLPSRYHNYKIPYGYAVRDEKLNSEINAISLQYFKEYFSDLIRFYNIKSNYFQRKNDFLSLKSTLRKIIPVILIAIFILIFFIKRKDFLKTS